MHKVKEIVEFLPKQNRGSETNGNIELSYLIFKECNILISQMDRERRGRRSANMDHGLRIGMRFDSKQVTICEVK